MSKITGTQIVIEWIISKKGTTFDYLVFQKEIHEFAKPLTNKFYRQDSFDRYLRFALGSSIIGTDVSEVPGKWKTWEVK